MSPCIKCGESAKEKHGGVVGYWMGYDENDEARYYCLDCTIEKLKDSLEE